MDLSRLFTVQLSLYDQRFALSIRSCSATSEHIPFQSSFIVVIFSATAYLLYRDSVNRLSTTFLFSFASFSLALCLSAVLAVSFVYTTICISDCQHSLQFFFKKFSWIFLTVDSPCNSCLFSVPNPVPRDRRILFFIQFLSEMRSDLYI